jgi:hypothetical protein
MIPLSVGFGLGLGDGEGEVDSPEGFLVKGLKSGVAKFSTGSLAMATDMKSCQMAAGMDPPVTPGTPSTFSMGFSDLGYPSQTQAASCGV